MERKYRMSREISNYVYMRDQMERKFAEHDMEKMIRKFQLDQDETYLYIRFAGHPYRIRKSSGRVEGSFTGRFEDAYHASYNEAMTIFDVLAYSKDGCTPAGTFNGINNLRGVVRGAVGEGSSMFQKYAEYFDRHKTVLASAMEALGGTAYRVGDIAYQMPLFDFLPVILQFWESDEEFPASLKVMWDENILDYMHYETTYFALTCLLDRIRAEIENRISC